MQDIIHDPYLHRVRTDVGNRTLFPLQGGWSVAEYLALETNQLIEFSDGYLEFPPMPTMAHQQLILYLCNTLLAFATAHDLGTVLFAGLHVRLWPGQISGAGCRIHGGRNTSRRMGKSLLERGRIWSWKSSGGSGEDRDQQDLVEKRGIAPARGIAEYWIVDPQGGTRHRVAPCAASPTSSTAISAKGEPFRVALAEGFHSRM